MKEQTAVEWLEEQIVKFHNWKLNPTYDKSCFDEIELNNAIQKAKEMEANQHNELIVKSYKAGSDYTINLMEKIAREKLEGM